MFPGLRFTLLIPLAAILGCGVTPTPSTPSSSVLNLTGDWVVLAPPNPLTPLALPTPVADFMGALQSSGSTITGTFRAISPAFPQCVSFTQDLPVSGTIGSSNKATLTIPIAGGTATITATITTPQSYTNGTWQIVGGACAMPLTAIEMAEFAPATGTYTGTLNVLDLTTNLPVPGTATAVTATLVQATTPNADGQFPLSGTITASGGCTVTFSITNEVVAGGLFMQVPPGSSTVNMVGGILPTGTPLLGGFSAFSACGSQVYTGTLTRQ
jgi:hypothetical protein